MDSTLWRLCYDGGPASEADWFTDCCTLSTLLIGEAGIGFPSSLIPADCPSIKAGCSLLIRATVEQITRWTSQCLDTPYACLYYISSERTYKSCASLSDVRSTFCREFYGTCLERLKIRRYSPEKRKIDNDSCQSISSVLRRPMFSTATSF